MVPSPFRFRFLDFRLLFFFFLFLPLFECLFSIDLLIFSFSIKFDDHVDNSWEREMKLLIEWKQSIGSQFIWNKFVFHVDPTFKRGWKQFIEMKALHRFSVHSLVSWSLFLTFSYDFFCWTRCSQTVDSDSEFFNMRVISKISRNEAWNVMLMVASGKKKQYRHRTCTWMSLCR